ncbi:hypothetical protein KSP39_PZI000190 [Platanthera zijinensis]|uniref:Uncharacterized protein n=1 Tax=Platanthera zijinensis TaxID=2320716 RepID=A0AAP0C0F5_9ASPA
MKPQSRPSTKFSHFLRCRAMNDDDDDDGGDGTPSTATPATSSPDHNFDISDDHLAGSSSYTMSPYIPSSVSSPFVKSPWIHSTAAVAPFPNAEDSSTGLLGSLIRQDGHVYSLAAAGNLLYTGSDSKNIRIWKNCGEFGGFKSSSGLVKSIVLFRGKIFTGHQDGKIRVWKRDAKGTDDSTAHKRVGTLPRFKDCIKSSVRPSNYVAVRRHRSALWLRHFDAVSCLALNAEQGLLYSGSWDRTFKVWRVSDSKCVASVNAHDDAVNAVASAFGNTVLTGSADGTVKVWEREGTGTGKYVAVRTLLRQESAVTAIAVAEKGGAVYCGTSDGRVRFWVEGRRMERGGVLRCHEKAVLCLAAAGSLVVSGSADGTVRVWRREAVGRHVRVAVLTGHTGPVKCLAVEEDEEGGGEAVGRWLVYSGSLDKSVRVWRVAER